MALENRKTIVGVSAMASANAFRVGVQMLLLPVVARFLGPEACGQLALVMPFIFFSALIAESGMGASLVRSEQLTRALESTITTYCTLVSVVLMALLALLAHPLAYLLGDSMFAPLLKSMSCLVLLAALNIVPTGLLLRAKKYDSIARADILSTLSGVLALIIGIMMSWGVWSLMAQQLTLWMVKLMLTMHAARYLPRFQLRFSILKEQIGFASNLSFSALIAFIARNIDNVLVGKFMGTQALGYYAFAYQIAGLPAMVMSDPVYNVVLSVISDARRRGERITAHILTALKLSLLICAPVMVGLAVTAHMAVPLILGEDWIATADLLILFAPLGLLQALWPVLNGAIVSTSRSDITFRIVMITSIVTIIAIGLGARINSNTVAVGVTLAAMPGYWLLLRAVMQLYGIGLGALLSHLLTPLCAALAMGAVVVLLGNQLPQSMSVLARLLLCISAGLASYALLLRLFFRDYTIRSQE